MSFPHMYLTSFVAEVLLQAKKKSHNVHMKFPVKWVFPMLCIHCQEWVVTEYIHYVGNVPGECYLSQF